MARRVFPQPRRRARGGSGVPEGPGTELAMGDVGRVLRDVRGESKRRGGRSRGGSSRRRRRRRPRCRRWSPRCWGSGAPPCSSPCSAARLRRKPRGARQPSPRRRWRPFTTSPGRTTAASAATYYFLSSDKFRQRRERMEARVGARVAQGKARMRAVKELGRHLKERGGPTSSRGCIAPARVWRGWRRGWGR